MRADYVADEHYDCITARACGSLQDVSFCRTIVVAREDG
jgi:hypothetical protein